MKKLRKIIILAIFTIINAIIVSCGNNAKAEGGYELQYLFGYKCITNGQSIWCDKNG